MAATIPNCEPESAFSNDSIAFDISVSDYPPSGGWTLAYVFRGAEDWATTVGDITAQGTYWQVRIPGARTASITPGMYQWFATVTSGSERHTVRSGLLQLLPDPTAAVNATTHAVRTLAIIEAALEGRLTADMENYQIGGRQVTKIPAAELLRQRGIYRFQVWREQNPGKSYPQHAVTFVSP